MNNCINKCIKILIFLENMHIPIVHTTYILCQLIKWFIQYLNMIIIIRFTSFQNTPTHIYKYLYNIVTAIMYGGGALY